MVQAKERGIQSPKRPLCLLGSRKRTRKSRILSPFAIAIATPRCRQNFRYFSLPRRAEGSRLQRLPIAVPVCFSASCRLPLHPFPSRLRRESTRRLPPKSPASHHLRNPPSNPPKRTTSALPWSSLSPLRWSGDPYGRGLI